MTPDSDEIKQLLEKMELLLRRQDDFSKEIDHLRTDIDRLRTKQSERGIEKAEEQQVQPVNYPQPGLRNESLNDDSEIQQKQILQVPPQKPVIPLVREHEGKSNLEKFIGENLINKIGIVITVIGVAIGAKYAIEHQLVSPLTRIISGYFAGLVLMGFAIKLKKNYENFSAVLLSGAMAIMYFITFAAFSFYNLIPQALAFCLMVIFTAFTVLAALKYNRQVIAHIGLVGAYAVPFLLSTDSGKIEILFTYTAVINAGILVIAFKKYWKPVYYSAFGLTWLMYFGWYAISYQSSKDFALALIFLLVFFVIFYMTFMAYKLLQQEKFRIDDVILLLINSFIFYGIGYALLNNNKTGQQLLGLFTLGNAVIHFTASILIYYRKLSIKDLLYLVSALSLVFVTIAIPVQLNGNWVTLLWAGEAALMFWIGRTKNVPVYEKISYPLMILAFCSILQDWATAYNNYFPERPESRIIPLLNINFLSSILFIAAFGFIWFLNRNKKYPSTLLSQKETSKIFSFSISAILIFTIYYAFRMEIATYWNQLHMDALFSKGNQFYIVSDDLNQFKSIWLINYSLFFVSALVFVTKKWLKDQLSGLIAFILISLTLAFFLTRGLYVLSELRESFLEQKISPDSYYLWIRYISLAFVALTFVCTHMLKRQDFMQKKIDMAFDFLLSVSVLWIACSEFIHWMDIARSTQSYKLGLSILCGTYSLSLIVLGIWKKKKHLRIEAFALFGITLIKLFFYDLSHLDTIAKTIVFVSLGVLLLITSFLYNKYKHLISDEADN
jgi:uncharacterized membrane protein